MKKIILIMFLVITPFLLAGCGKKEEKKPSNMKEVTCNAEISGMDSVIKFQYDTKENAIKEASVKYTMDLSVYTDDQLKVLKETDLCASYVSEQFGECKSKLENKKLELDVALNIEPMIETEFNSKQPTLDELVSSYEKNLSAKCTVE